MGQNDFDGLNQDLEEEDFELDWSVFGTQGTIEPHHVELLIEFDENDDRFSFLEERGEEYVAILLNLVTRLTQTKHLSAVLRHLNTFTFDFEEFISLFDQGNETILQLISVLRRKEDEPLVLTKLTQFLKTLFFHAKSNVEEAIVAYIDWAFATLDATDEKTTKIYILSSFMKILRKPHYRYILLHNGVERLYSHIAYVPKQNIQVLYQAVHCVWLLTLSEDIAITLTNNELVINLVTLLKKISKEKVLRLSLAILKNIFEGKDNNEKMIVAGIMRRLYTMNDRQWGDDDMEEDLAFLIENLEKVVSDLSTFDRYRQEVLTHSLEWTSACHKSERFWRENCMRFQEKDFEVLRALKEIIEVTSAKEDGDPKLLAIACWDIGEFVRFHPRGKSIIQMAQCKIPIMQLLDHENADVKKEALLALQKLMVTNWEYL
eukprot:TRINITY_DN7005_c0_g2_i1.p1 TRINITY_DN7005_c0_g2~~TRINITY_DN7005_c0_g2_i1.p1  ORF type:complete len:450 (+),score=108.38 TRINITY_DN7005_c0_g2_i1:54-1352(+)